MKLELAPNTSSKYLVLFTITALLAGCPSSPPANGGNNTGGFGGTAGFNAGGTGGFAGTNTAGSGGGSAGTGTVGGRATMGTTGLPCDVTDIIKLRCGTCHGASPVGGPMALVSWEDFEAPALSNPALKVRDVVAQRIASPTAPMPPAPSAMLAGTELSTVQAWLTGGGIAGTDPSCAPGGPDAGGPPIVGVPDFADNCYEIRAHADGNKSAPLMVEGEDYATFYFDAPWPADAQGVYFETLFGDDPGVKAILHHWLIYAEQNGNQPDGKVDYPGLGYHASTPTLVAGWAPGADNNDLPDNVGLQLAAANQKMSMEIHFFGPAGTTLPVNAGVRICTVEKPERKRPNTATISWLGTENINIPPMAQDATATGTCNPVWTAGLTEIHILRSWPHMHLMGRKMKSTIIRSDGTRVPMHSGEGWPFDFNSEISHKTEFVLKQGDRVETTCHYTSNRNETVNVGFENRYEMCFNFVTAYPASALVNKGILGGSSSLTGSATGCLQ